MRRSREKIGRLVTIGVHVSHVPVARKMTFTKKKKKKCIYMYKKKLRSTTRREAMSSVAQLYNALHPNRSRPDESDEYEGHKSGERLSRSESSEVLDRREPSARDLRPKVLRGRTCEGIVAEDPSGSSRVPLSLADAASRATGGRDKQALGDRLSADTNRDRWLRSTTPHGILGDGAPSVPRTIVDLIAARASGKVIGIRVIIEPRYRSVTIFSYVKHAGAPPVVSNRGSATATAGARAAPHNWKSLPCTIRPGTRRYTRNMRELFFTRTAPCDARIRVM